MKNDQKQSSIAELPPIPDANNNGVLDGADILAQLNKEDATKPTRTPADRAHGVLDAMLVTNFVTEFAIAEHKYPGFYDGITTTFAGLLENKINDTVKALNKQPAPAPKQTEAQKEKFNNAFPISATDEALLAANATNLKAFAETFATTFPNGVRIAPNDVPMILSHFGEIPVKAKGRK